MPRLPRYPTVEEYITAFLRQPGTSITAAELAFVEAMRTAAKEGVGYGWMRQMCAIEWSHMLQGPIGSDEETW